jgi:type I restriction enzyme S subunit
MELKPEYKQTEVGLIPQDWECNEIQSIAFVTSGKRLPLGSSLTNEETPHPYIRVTDMRPGTVSLHDIKYVPPEVFPAIKRYRIFKEDIFISVAGTLGIVGKVPPSLDGANLTENADRLTDIRCSQDYLLHVMMSPLIQNTVESLQTIGAQPKLALTRIRKFFVPLPSTKAEQNAIAEVLSDADALIESLEQLLAKKRLIKEGAMQELLTGKKRLPTFENTYGYKQCKEGLFPADWKQISLSEACSKIQDGTHFSPRAGGQDFLYITSRNIRFGFLDLSTAESIDTAQHKAIYKRCDVRKGDLLLTKDGANTGNAALNSLDEQFSLLSSVAFLRFDPALHNPEYFVQQILSLHGQCQIQEAMSGNAITRLTLAKIRKLTFPIPPTKSEQDAIATVLSAMDSEALSIEARLAKSRQLKQGMMQELLTGRIRLLRPSAQVLSFPAKESASVANVPHNPQINEAVVIAVLSAKFGSEQFPFGRFRRTKFSYLLHRHAEHETAGFLKKAAGPYDPRTRYGGAEKIALQNRYVRVVCTGKSEGFIAAENIAQAEGYFEKWYGTEALAWLEQFHYQKNDALELLTTVEMACEDLSRAGKVVTTSTVKQIIYDSPEWKAKLNRSVFSDDNIAATIETCRQLFSR